MIPFEFRAWNRVKKKFVYIYLFTGTLAYSESPDKRSTAEELEPWQIFTGVCDKNKIKIYCGDFVMCRHKSLTAEIIWWHCGFRMEWRKDSPRLKHLDVMDRQLGHENLWGNSRISLEVIGNIYENPELLK